MNKSAREHADRIATLADRMELAPKRCLDVGCGTGYLLQQLQVQNWAVIVGLTLGDDKPEIEEFVTEREQVNGQFDLITCVQALERVDDAGEWVGWMIGKLATAGTLIIETQHRRPQAEYTLSKLGAAYSCIEDGENTIILVGERYKDMTTKKVFYSFDSPDMTSQEEYLKWLSMSYGKAAK
jgi:2-polyprenyl-3-methyl-5-hydroxy-6-metoxy-1,4-benzoquinol methylase